jgi:hypothetical protein
LRGDLSLAAVELCHQEWGGFRRIAHSCKPSRIRKGVELLQQYRAQVAAELRGVQRREMGV